MHRYPTLITDGCLVSFSFLLLFFNGLISLVVDTLCICNWESAPEQKAFAKLAPASSYKRLCRCFLSAAVCSHRWEQTLFELGSHQKQRVRLFFSRSSRCCSTEVSVGLAASPLAVWLFKSLCAAWWRWKQSVTGLLAAGYVSPSFPL